MIVVPVYDEGVRIRLMVYFIININLVGAGLLSGCKQSEEMRLRDGACVLNDLTKFNGLRASLTNLPNQFQINIECIVETQVAIANSYTLPITADLHFT